MNITKKQAKHTLLASSIMVFLICTMPAQAAPILNDGTPNRTNMINTDFSIGSGETVTTWSRTSERPATVRYNGNIFINSGGIWRPMDAKAINVYGTFELGKNALLDLSYKYGENYLYNLWPNYIDNNTAYTRNFLAYGTTILHDGSIIRLNVGGGTGSDKLVFNKLQLAMDEDTAKVILQIRYNKNTGGLGEQGSTTNFWDSASASVYSGTINGVITINDLTEAVDNNLGFSAQTYYVDSSLNKYLFVPTLTSSESTYNDVTTKSYNLDWTATRTDLVSQGVFSAANAQLSMRNLWRIEDGLFWKRGEELRAANRLGQSEDADGAWAQIWRGDYSYGGAYGSSFGQSYKGIQVGYDKQREGELFGGKVYTGVFFNMLNSNADFHQHTLSSGSDQALYSSSSGDLKSSGIGLYTSWIGDKGHYLDFTVRGSKLSNDYKFYDSDDNLYNNDYGTWTYGAGVRYGYQKELQNGWYMEPQAGLSYGKMDSYSYMQDNNMRYTQDEMGMLIGRLGVTAGRNFTSGDKRGTVYAKAAVNHDFMDGGKARADAMYWSSYINQNGITGEGYRVAASLPIDTLAGKDTWYEFALGTTLQTGKDQNAFVELMKTVGGKVNTDWQVNAGMSWSFGGGDSSQAAKLIGTEIAADKATKKVQPSQADKTVQDGQAASETGKTGVGDKLTTPTAQASQQTDNKTQVNQKEQVKTEQTSQAEAASQTDTEKRTTVTTSTPIPENAPIVTAGNEPGNFTLGPLVVEAKRPDWEKNLSPGTVSVIHVPEYKGEMKNLPDLLQTVPGVYVQRLQGTGHYTVARVRGSTGGEVNIYVDGVLVNSNADAAVDLSTIPVENVERIEVYRGYVPARFAGSPLGGAINIVTKKPTGTKGSITTGLRSFNGYTGNLELTAPVGNGSLLFALNRDQAKGDFKYDHFSSSVLDAATGKPLTATRYRLNNDYQNTDALLKWQDDNWFAKLTYKKNTTRLPESAMDRWADAPYNEVLKYYDDSGVTLNPDWKQYRERQIDTTKTEFQLGRRQSAGNLEWGWKMNTSNQFKQASSSQYKAANGNYFLTLDNEFHNRRYEGALDGSWKLGKNHLVEFLFDYAKETMDVSINNPNAWPPQVNSVTGDMKYYAKYFVPHYDNRNYYFQLQDTMTLNKSGNLFFTPQFKAQKWDMSTLNQIGDPDIGRWLYSYGLGLKKVQNEHWTFRGTYGTYYKFPNFYELFGDGVNVKSRWETYRNGYTQFEQDSLIERGTSWDVSANWQGKALAADSDVTLTYFNRDSKNLSTYALDFYGFGYYSNLAAGKIQGLELESKFKWDRWDLLLSATWNDSLVTKSGKDSLVTKSDINAGNPFPWIPEWEYNARLSYRFPGDKLSAFTEYHYLGKVGTAIDSVKVDESWSHHEKFNESLGLTNIGLKYDFNKAVKLTAGINDLFNKGPKQLWHYYGIDSVGHSSTGYGNIQYPQQGRTYYMTVQYFF